ncbi:MAG: DUF302 domain-containing protein [Hyphomicrobiales bacterium]
MGFIRNLLALVGLVAVVGLAFAGAKVLPLINSFDSEALATYKTMTLKLIETGSPAQATVWKTKVADGLSFEEVDESIQSIAIENNIKDVGALPLGRQIEAMTGEKWRQVKIYLYCNPLTAAKMMDYDDAYSAYLPCRVTLVEDKTGALWLYSLDMDMMIHGGHPLPDDVKAEAIEVKRIIQDVMKRGAEGDF